jgi:myosin X
MTNNFPEPGSPLSLSHWYLLGALCSSFLPSRKFAKYLRFHLRRTIENAEMNGDEVTEAAGFCLEALRKTKTRDFPPSTAEINGIITGKGLPITVNIVGGATHEFHQGSSTSIGEVLADVQKKLGLTECRNGFGLFESHEQRADAYLEEKLLVADVMSKWEKYELRGLGTWKLVFKLFTFLDPLNAKLSQLEQNFLFEQAFESVMSRRFPAEGPLLIQLAALRMQYSVGDYEAGSYISDLVKVHPAQQPSLIAAGGAGGSSGNTIVGTLKGGMKKMFKGTIRGMSKGTLKKLKSGGTMLPETQVSEKEMASIKADILKAWEPLVGMQPEDARKTFMEKIHSWNGYGANLFEVTHVSTTGPLAKFPKELWLAVLAEGVGVFPRGQRQCLAMYSYEQVLSFGAPVASSYRIVIDAHGAMIFDTNMVLEIAKLMKEYIRNIVTKQSA